MIENLFNLLIKIVKYNYNISVLIMVFIFLIIIIYSLLKKKIYNDYKIYSFFGNTFYIGIYSSIFIIGILILRYYRWGYNFDLLENLKVIKEFCYSNSLLGNINWFLILIIIFLLIMKIKNFLYYQIKKRHIYYYNKSLLDTHIYYEKVQRRKVVDDDFSFYVKLVKKLSFPLYSLLYYKDFHRSIISWSFSSLYTIFFEKEKNSNFKYPKIFIYIINIFTLLFKFSPYLLLLFLIFFDIYYNKYQIQLIFYYLPIFFIYQIWKNISLFLSKNDKSLDLIIYKLYYKSEICYYILVEEQYNFILTYIENNFVSYIMKNDFLNTEDDFKYIDNIFKIINDINQQMFIKLESSLILKNFHTLDEIELKDVVTIETKPLLKRTTNFCSRNDFNKKLLNFLSLYDKDD